MYGVNVDEDNITNMILTQDLKLTNGRKGVSLYRCQVWSYLCVIKNIKFHKIKYKY